jgi:hypothetical protein
VRLVGSAFRSRSGVAETGVVVRVVTLGLGAKSESGARGAAMDGFFVVDAGEDVVVLVGAELAMAGTKLVVLSLN